MSQQVAKTNEPMTASKVFASKAVQDRFEKLLGKKAQGFITSVLQAVQGNNALSKADPGTVLAAAATAAALDLPVNQSLGYSYIVPFKGKAQFQIGWKGYVQLALRTSQYQNINVVEVYDNQFKSWNPLTEQLQADFTVEGEGGVVGYVAYFKLINGFEKTVYWSREKVENHAKKYSQSYKKDLNNSKDYKTSLWSDEDQFDGMAKKTVLKHTLSKWGIMSIEMQTAFQADQSVVKDDGYEYPDNTIDLNVEDQETLMEIDRALDFINQVDSQENLNKLVEEMDEIANHPTVVNAISQKSNELKNGKG